MGAASSGDASAGSSSGGGVNCNASSSSSSSSLRQHCWVYTMKSGVCGFEKPLARVLYTGLRKWAGLAEQLPTKGAHVRTRRHGPPRLVRDGPEGEAAPEIYRPGGLRG